jgi:hypothetical protein
MPLLLSDTGELSPDEVELCRRYERFLAQQPFPTTSAELWVAVLRYYPLEGAVRSREVLIYDRAHRLLRTQTLAVESPYTVWYAGEVHESWHPLRLSSLNARGDCGESPQLSPKTWLFSSETRLLSLETPRLFRAASVFSP